MRVESFDGPADPDLAEAGHHQVRHLTDNSDVLSDPDRYHGAARLHSTLARADEPLRFGIDPSVLEGYLAERGFELQRDLGAADYRALHYGPRGAVMRGHEFYRVAFARARSAAPSFVA